MSSPFGIDGESIVKAIYGTIGRIAGRGGNMAIDAIGAKIQKDKYEKTKRERGEEETHKINPPPPDVLLYEKIHGFFFGQYQDRYVRKPEYADGHIVVVGGIGSGKSSCLAIPTCRGWEKRLFAIDIKGELYEKSKHRRPHTKVLDPFSDTAYGYDPFYILKDGNNPAQTAREIALAIIPTPPDIKDPFWIESAQNIFTAAILHFYNLGYDFLQTVQAVLETPADDLMDEIAGSKTRAARLMVTNFVNADDKMLSSIIAELSRHIMIFATDESLMSCLSRRNNITPPDLEKGYDIFIQIPEKLLRQWKGFLTLIVNQFLSFFEQREEATATPILFLLDEFPRLGKIPSIMDALATLRAKKITISLLIQDLSQLDYIYGREARRVIMGTCPYQAVLSVADGESQEYFSRLTGTYEKGIESDSINAGTLGRGATTGKGTTAQERRKIKPEEFGTNQDVILFTPQGFSKCKKLHY